jgi:hypothetical protein
VASKDYNANDVVQGSNGEFYVSLINGNVNNNPVTTSGSWTFLYSVEWNAGTTYKAGSVVTYETIVYQSLQNANLNENPSTATTYWVPIQLVWSATATYALDANVVGTDGVLYTSIQAANTGNIPASSPLWWVGTSAAAAASAVAAAASEAAALVSENAAAADAILTAADAVATAADAIATAADRVQTGLDASAAAASESAALISANAAAASYDLFDDRYLGAKASDPTLDNDGNALVTGAMYFNTVSNATRIYNGASWQDSAAIATSINLATQVTGTLPVANGGTGLTAPGTSGNVLTSNGSTWASAAAVPPGLVLLSTVTASAAATADIETTFDSTYDDYVIKVSGLYPASDNVIQMRLKIGGSYLSGGTEYRFTLGTTSSNTGTGTYSSSESDGQTHIELTSALSSSSANAGQITIHLSTPTVSKKHPVSWTGGVMSSTVRPVNLNGVGCNNATAGVLAGVRLLAASGNINCVARLYGVKK